MKKTIILYIILICCIQNIWAQSLHDGMYSKEWEIERDRVVREWDKKFSNIKKSFRPPIINAGQIHSKISGGIRIEQESKTTRAKNISTYKSNRKSYSVGSHNNNVSHYGELRQQWMEEARRKEAERKRRIAAENAADRQMGFARHTARMSSFYQQKYARDQYMMNEGARKLDESVHAKDFIDTPEPKIETMKGKDMAKILQKGKLIVSDIKQPLERDKHFNAGDKLNVTDKLELDENILNKWNLADAETNIIDLSGPKSSDKTKTKQPQVLISKDELCLDSMNLFILPQYGLVMQVGDSMRVLRDYELRAVSWADGKRYSHIVPCGNKLIGRDEQAIYEIKETNSTQILEFDTPDFSLFADNDSSVYCAFWHDGLSTIFRVNIKNNVYDEIARLPALVWKMESNGNETFVMIDNTIFIMDRKNMPHILYKSEEDINDVTLSPWGLLIATDQGITRVKSVDENETFYSVAAKYLWCHDNEVYIQTKEGDLLYMENGTDYITN